MSKKTLCWIHRVSFVCLVAVGTMAAGCASDTRVEAAAERSPQQSNRLLSQALAQIETGRYATAEPLLHEALEADAYNGAVYNALGTVYYHQRRLYQAAWQFRYAAKLLPHEPEPLNNLGLVLEAAGRWDEAIQQYEQAVEQQPTHPELLGNYVRSRLRRGDRGEVVNELLRELLLHETRPAWREWAERELAGRGIENVDHWN